MVARLNNETRLKKMKKRNECIENLKVLAISRLSSNFDKDTPQYQTTLKNLIIQVSKRALIIFARLCVCVLSVVFDMYRV